MNNEIKEMTKALKSLGNNIQKLFNQQYEIFKRINTIIDYLKSKGE
jgi:uncharacterized protein YoxC